MAHATSVNSPRETCAVRSKRQHASVVLLPTSSLCAQAYYAHKHAREILNKRGVETHMAVCARHETRVRYSNA